MTGTPNNGLILNYADTTTFTTGWCDSPTVARPADGAGRSTAMCTSNSGSFYFNQVAPSDFPLIQRYLVWARDARVFAGSTEDGTTTFNQSRINVSGTKQVTLYNYRQEALEFSASILAAPASTNPGDFAVAAPASGDCAISGTRRVIPAASTTAAGQCTVTLQFQPQPDPSPNRSASLRVTALGTVVIPTRDHTLSLTGSVPVAQYAYAPVAPQPAFIAQVNTSAGPFSLGTIRNNGSATLQVVIDPPVVSGGNATYSLASTALTKPCVASQTLVEGDSCNVYVAFSPGATPGTTNATFAVRSSANGVPTTQTPIGVTGTGTSSILAASGATLSVSNTTLAFGDSQTNQPKTLTFALMNGGSAPLTFSTSLSTRFALSGANPSSFVVGGSCSTVSGLGTTGPTATCTVSVRFTPTTLSPYAATLTVNSDADSGPLVLSLTGNGVQLPTVDVALIETTVPQGVINEPAPDLFHVNITNNRAYPVTYSLVGPSTTDFVVVPTAPTTDCPSAPVVPVMKSCIVTLQFRPALGSGEGSRSGTLMVGFTNAVGDPNPSATVTLSGNALLPLRIPATVLTPSAIVNTSTTVTTFLMNKSASPLTIGSIAFSNNLPADPAATEYAVDASSGCRNGFVLASGSSCPLVVRFTPSTATLRSATLTIVHAAVGSPQTIDLRGTGLDAPKGRIEVGSNMIGFADTPLGSQSSQTVTVHNGAADATLILTGFALSGAASADFARSGDCSVTSPLGPLQSCLLTLTFAPSALGVRSAALTIQTNGSTGSALISLLGNGIPVPVPVLDPLPPTVPFGNQTIGGLYLPKPVTLKNTGTAPLVVASVVVDGAGFTIVNPTACTISIAPGASCDVSVTFAPTLPSAYQATLRVVSNAAGSPHVTTLAGTGTASAAPSLVWSPATTQLAFGTVSAGAVSAVQSVTLSNRGPGGATITLTNAVGVDAASFSVSSSTCTPGATLFDGASCRFDVTFAPGSSGTKNAVLQIASTGSAPPPLTLTGIGLAGPNAALALSATSMTFEATRVGAQSAPQEITLSATGTGAVQVTAIGVSGPYVVQSRTCAATPFVLAAGVTCTITATFQPQGTGVSGGSVRVTTDVSPTNHDVALSGQGTPAPNVSGGGGSGGGGGCSIASGDSPLDPTLWALVILAVAALLYRRQARRRDDDRSHGRR